MARPKLAALAVLVCAAATGAPPAHGSAATARDLRIETSPLMVQHVNGKRPAAPAESGAYGLNAAWERGEVAAWNVAWQREGGNAIVHGIVTGQRRAINEGLRAFDWALDRRRDDGSFADVDSSLYQYAFFVHAVARSALLLEESPMGPAYATAIARLRERLRSTVDHMRTPAMVERGERVNDRYTHRFLVVASAFQLAGSFLHDRSYRIAGNDYMRRGFARQRRNGVNPEAGGHDSSYQAIGLLYAQRWLLYHPAGKLRKRMRRKITKGMRWQAGRVTRTGRLRTFGDTRTRGQEVRPADGKVKDPSYVSIFRSLVYFAERRGVARYKLKADRMMARRPRPLESGAARR